MRRVRREWERALLWASVVVLSLVVAVLLSRLAGEKGASQARLPPARSSASYLNEKTAFDFLQPSPSADASARNPFAFSCRLPPPKAEAKPVEPAREAEVKPAERLDPVLHSAEPAKGSAEPVVPPPPPKRTTTILYRGLYSGGRETARQLAFISTLGTPGDVTATAVLAPGQQAAGVTVKRMTPVALVVAGPTGVEVSIAVGTQAQIALE
jgi:hypothetical protein